MEILFLILKIILIALLIVLGLIVILIGMVLFVPVCYEVSGSVGDAWELKIKGKLTYLLSIFKLIFSYQNGQTDMQIYLFGFQKKKTEDSSEQEENDESVEENVDAEITIHEKKEKRSDEVSNDSKTVATKQETIPKEKEKEEKKQNKFDFTFWKQQLTDEHNRNVIRKIGSELKYLLKHFRFRKIQTDLIFSTGDPSSTGQVLGIICMIPILYQYEFKIIPDFEADEAYLKGTFLVTGKVRLIHVLITVLRLTFDKEVRLVAGKVLSMLK